jgi:hypothetical protein
MTHPFSVRIFLVDGDRLLAPYKPNGAGKWFYCPNMLKEFDKHYTPKKTAQCVVAQ